jgi:hypothetical protein
MSEESRRESAAQRARWARLFRVVDCINAVALSLAQRSPRGGRRVLSFRLNRRAARASFSETLSDRAGRLFFSSISDPVGAALSLALGEKKKGAPRDQFARRHQALR